MSDLHRDCTGYELAIGAVTGLRYFTVDKLGRLRGKTFSAVWRPGENTAACHAGSEVMQMTQALNRQIAAMFRSYNLSPVSVSDPPLPSQPAMKSGHHVPVEKCGCGFWAFTDHDYKYGASEDVAGVVEGHGRTLIGTKGFRVEKAEIVALRVPSKGWRHWQFWAVFYAVTCAGNVRTAVTSNALWVTIVGAVLAAVMLAFLVRTVVFRRYSEDPRAELLRRNYPNVHQYPTVKAMLAAHPLTETVPPSPDSDPDFWKLP